MFDLKRQTYEWAYFWHLYVRVELSFQFYQVIRTRGIIVTVLKLFGVAICWNVAATHANYEGGKDGWDAPTEPYRLDSHSWPATSM